MFRIDRGLGSVVIQEVPTGDDRQEPRRGVTDDLDGSHLTPTVDPILVMGLAGTLARPRDDVSLGELGICKPAHGIVATLLVVIHMARDARVES